MIAGNGFVSLLTGLEVVPVTAAGPLAEPIGVAVAGVLIAVRAARTPTTARLLPVECLLIAYLGVVLVPSLVTLVGGGGAAMVLLARTATGPFAIVDALLAAVLGLILTALARARDAGAGRPRWPWEEDGDP